MPSKRQKVIIIGGGVAGLTAAHELIERDFDVEVYERRMQFGGKAASQRVQLTPSGPSDYPGEHGFRFFPAWYRHLPDTLGRIPRRGQRKRVRDLTVADNLVATERNLLARYNRPSSSIILHAPMSASGAQAAFDFVRNLAASGLPVGDVLTFFRLLAEFLRTPLDEREKKYDAVSWWDFIRAEERSEAFRTVTVATTRTLLAAKAEVASAYTVATMAIRTLFDSPNRPDRVLDGPTNEVWIDPWVSYLEGRGVKFRPGCDLESVFFEGDGPRIRGVSFVKSDDAVAFRLLREAQREALQAKEKADALAPLVREAREKKKEGWVGTKGDDVVATMKRAHSAFNKYAQVVELLAFQKFARSRAAEDPDDLRENLAEKLPQEPGEIPLEPAEVLLQHHRPKGERRPMRPAIAEAYGHFDNIVKERTTIGKVLKARSEADRESAHSQALGDYVNRVIASRAVIEAMKTAPSPEDLCDLAKEALRDIDLSIEETGTEDDLYVFSIPVEQMAYYVSVSTTMRSYDDSLERLTALSGQVDWMAGIQFYLKSPLNIDRGHIVCADTEWALTAIEQTQFWTNVDLPKGAESVLSVDISAWDQPGRFNRRPAFLCTPSEIAKEVWSQLKASLNRSGEQDILRETALVNGAPETSFHLDDNIIERYDRRKQGAYVAAQARTIRRLQALEPEQAQADPEQPSAFVSGERLALNVEPLLVNRPHSLRLRPDVRTKIDNMFLAADYVKTSTNLVSMEGANEAARRAVNVILEATGSLHEPCRLFDFEDREILVRLVSIATFADRLGGAQTSREAATDIAGIFASLARRATDNVRQIWKKP